MGNSCDKLAPRASALGKQARTAYNSNGYAGVCDSLTQANPNSLPMPPPGGQQDDSPLQKAQSDFCRRNPSAADCQTQNETAANGNPENNPSPGFDNGSDLAEASGEGRFNLPGDDSQLDPSGFGPLDGIEAQSLSYGTVANNSGGSIPGGGDSGSAQLGGPAGGVQRGGSPGSPGYSTDIMQGNRSGGYSQPVGMNNNGSDDGSGSDYRRNQGGRHTASSDAPRMGLDLKQFLPGGSKDPLRRVGGMRRGKDIHGPSVDIWNKISTRFKHECRLTPLYDCDI